MGACCHDDGLGHGDIATNVPAQPHRCFPLVQEIMFPTLFRVQKVFERSEGFSITWNFSFLFKIDSLLQSLL